MFLLKKNKVPAYILPVLFAFCASKVGKLHLFRARFLDSGSRFVQNVTMRRFRTVFIALIESKNQVNPLKFRISMTFFRNQPGTRFNKLLHNLYSTTTATCLFLLKMPHSTFFRALQPKRLRVFYWNFAHTFLLVLLTGVEECAINTRCVSLNFCAYFNENGPKHWNCYFWHSNKRANCTDTFSRDLARCGVPIAMCVKNLNQIAPGVYAVWLPKKLIFDWKFTIFPFLGLIWLKIQYFTSLSHLHHSEQSAVAKADQVLRQISNVKCQIKG